MHLHNYETVELYAQSDGGALCSKRRWSFMLKATVEHLLKATVKHINAIIIWYHMHDVETLGVAFSRVNCDIYEMMF